MRQYNESALEGEDLRFYGFDMQRLSSSMRFLKESCKELEVDTTNLQKLVEGENWSSECDLSTRTETLHKWRKNWKARTVGKCNSLVDILMQHSELQTLTNDDGATLRDQFMAENVQWILQQEQRNGHEKSLWQVTTAMSQNGAVLTRWVNFFPRTQQTVTMSLVPIFIKPIAICRPVRLKSVQFRCFIHDPLAKAAKLAGFDICWLDFTKVPENSETG